MGILFAVLSGCGAELSQTSRTAAGRVVADAVLYGGAAAAMAFRAPSDERSPTFSEPPRMPAQYAYLCEIEGEEETVEARSLEAAQRACGGPEECLCEEPQALTTTARRATR